MSPKLKILLVGPCHPADIFDLCYDFDTKEIANLDAIRGIPVSDLARALIQFGHEVTIISLLRRTKRVIELKGKNFKFVGVGSPLRFRHQALTFFSFEIRLIKQAIEKEQFDIINAHWTYEYAIAAMACSKKVIVTAHDSPISVFLNSHNPYHFIRILLAMVVRIRVKKLVFVSKFLQQEWKKYFRWNGHFAIIPNVLTESKFPTIKAEPAGDFSKVVSVGQGDKLKNMKILLRAWRRVIVSRPNAFLTVIGPDLGEGGSLHRWSQDHGLDGNVIWRGTTSRERTLKEIEGSHLMVHPSKHESFGLAIYEAASYAVPVIVSTSAKATHVLVDIPTLQFETKSIFSLTKTILNALSNDELRRQLGAYLKKKYETLPNSKAIANIYTDLYLQEISERKYYEC